MRAAPYIKPMEESTASVGMGILFLPPSVNEPQDPFALEDYGDENDVDGQPKPSEEEKISESPCKIHQGILKAKNLPGKAPKFSIKKHLRTSYYAKRR